VYFENRTDRPLHVFRISSDGRNKYPSTVLPPRHAEARPGKSGAVWVVEDETGKCLAAYTAEAAGKNERVKIGDKDLKVRMGVPPNRLKTTVFPGFSVKPDGDVYVDSQNVSSTVGESLNLWVARPPAESGSNSQPSENNRYLEFDLSQPVTTSGAKVLGLIRDAKARIHVFLSHDHERHTIRNIQELASGDKAQSERVQFMLSINGIPHVLLVGPWGPGEFGPAQKTPINGDGTTKATVKRISDTVWEVDAPTNTLGRLWENADTATPIDRGLYRVSFRFRFELLPDE
jgi:hypothetical protein